MSQITEAVTKKVAGLARLELSEEELKHFTTQLSDILGYVEKLNELDQETKNVAPLFHPLDLETPMREDVIKKAELDEQGRSKVLGTGPDVLYDGFKVPPIM